MSSALQQDQNRVLEPLKCLSDSDARILLVLLNQPLGEDWAVLKLLWKKAQLVACVDGGANRLYECLAGEDGSFLPHVITGDLDSIRPDVQQFFQSKGVEVVRTEDQDYTDFTKCLQLCLQRCAKLDAVVVSGCFGGRLDHVLGNVHTLYQSRSLSPAPVLLLHQRSLACLLPPGQHVLRVDSGWEDDWCGLLPVGAPCLHVSTTGLKWNLNDNALQFGELVSTSNTYDGSGHVSVSTDQPLLWTMGVKYRCPL